MISRTLLLGAASLAVMAGAAAPALAQNSAHRAPAFAVSPDADAQHVYPDGSTPLMWAVYEGDAERVRALIRAGTDVNAANAYGANAMQLAAEVADQDILKLLLDAGADVNSPNPEGQTALMLVARTGNVEAARLLVRAGADIDARENWGEQTALMWAAARRHPDMVAYLAERGAALDVRSKWRDYQRHITSEARAKSLDTGGLTPLLYATRENCLDCVRALIAAGADVDLTDPDRVSPLLLAVLNANWDIADLLIESGADVNQWDKFGQAPLFAVSSRRTNTARRVGDPLNETTGGAVMERLIAGGANVNMQLFMRPAKQRGGGASRGTTPLHAAAMAGDLDGVRTLLTAGADVNLNDADNETALMFATQARGRNGVEVMRVLLEAGADPNANSHGNHLARTRGGTALHFAVRAGSAAAVDELVAAGADVNIKDPDGLTALDYAMARGYIPFLESREAARTDLADKLRAAGAAVELAEEPYWPPVSPPIYYDAAVWPLDPSIPGRSYEDMTPSPYLDQAIASLEYTGTPQPQPKPDPQPLASRNQQTNQASLNAPAQNP